VRVVIAEDSVLLREGLTRLLAEAGHEVVASAGQAEEFLREVGEHQPDVVVVDVRMPPTFTDEGLRAALVVRSTWPAVGVLVLSQYVEERYATELLSDRPQGVGYLLKDRVADLTEFLDALDRVAAQGSVLKHINNIFAKLGLAPADRDHRRVLAVLRYLGADGT
jgi:DNA-binding NarL/FixJ family response regulator